MASEKKYKTELYRSARRLRRVFTQGEGVKDKDYSKRAIGLLEAAVAWRDSACRVAKAEGTGQQPRPKFAGVPRKTNPTNPPGHRRYNGALTWWASRYAWDKADGLPVEEAAMNLMRTAIVGTREDREKRRRKAEHERATTKAT